MDSDHPIGQSEYEETASLVRELDALKRRGSNLLVVSAENRIVDSGLCQHFLGESTTSTRRRTFVFTSAEDQPADRLPGPLTQYSDDVLQVVRFESVDRSAAAVSPPMGNTFPFSETRVQEHSLKELGIAISESIDVFERASGELEPAEFRLCFDSLAPILEEFDEKLVFRFVHLLTHRIRSVNGMAHFHLPVRPEEPVAKRLAPLFDAIIEFSMRNGTLKQRWSLRNGELRTDWLEL